MPQTTTRFTVFFYVEQDYLIIMNSFVFISILQVITNAARLYTGPSADALTPRRRRRRDRAHDGRGGHKNWFFFDRRFKTPTHGHCQAMKWQNTVTGKLDPSKYWPPAGGHLTGSQACRRLRPVPHPLVSGLFFIYLLFFHFQRFSWEQEPDPNTSCLQGNLPFSSDWIFFTPEWGSFSSQTFFIRPHGSDSQELQQEYQESDIEGS